MLPFTKTQLVVFAVVLILPALQSGGFLSGTKFHDDCVDILDFCGERKCYLEGSGGFQDYDPNSCTLTCVGPARPKVPDGVCSGNVINCTSSTRESLLNWKYTLQSTVNGVLKIWCQCFQRK
uniref:Putative ixodes 10 kDa peptide protein n=1 Tax=Ixodes ricinus TaxID=34613 RepID=A0A0K8RM19_IXORI